MSALFHPYLCGRKAAEWLINMDNYIDKIKGHIRDFIEQYDTEYNGPIVYYLKNVIHDTLEYLDSQMALYPNFKLLYSVKPNMNPEIMSLLAQHLSGFDAASNAELKTILDYSSSCHFVSASGYAFSREDLLKAIAAGINVDFMSVRQIESIVDSIENVNIGIRIKVPCSNYEKVMRKSSRFGLNYATDFSAVSKLCAEKNLVISGIHLHGGLKTLESIVKECDEIEKWTKKIETLSYINLGGGWDILAEKGKVEEAFSYITARFPNLQFYIEPGSLLVRNSGVLVAKVIDVHHGFDQFEYAVLDVSAFNLSSWYRPKLIALSSHHMGNPNSNVLLVGNTCYEDDVFGLVGNKVIQHGDAVFLYPAGAYFNTTSRHLHGLPFPTEKLI